MTMLNPNNYYTVAGWMLTDLGLRGNELTAYAVIYGFSQVADHRFHGSVRYLADWMGVSPKTAERCLKSLVEQGLLLKYDKEVNGVKFCEYAAVLPSMDNHDRRTPCQNDGTPTVNLTDNNIDIPMDISIPGVILSSPISDRAYNSNNPSPNILQGKEESITPTPLTGGAAARVPYEQIKNDYNAICASLPKCKVLTEERKRAIKARFAEGFTTEMFREVFRKAEASSFLKGGGKQGFVANLDFLIGTKAAKVLEGVYDDGTGAQAEEPPLVRTPEYTDEEFDRMFAVRKEDEQ